MSRLLISISVGLLMAFSDPAVWGQWYLFPISLFGYWYMIDRYNLKQIWWTPFAISGALNWALYFWAPMALTEMWHFPILVSGLLWTPIALVSEFQWLLLLIFIKYFNLSPKNLSTSGVIALACSYAAIESLFRLLFPDDAGLLLVSLPYLRQILDLSSLSLLSALFVIITLAVYQSIVNKKINTQLNYVVAGLIVLGYGYGFWRTNQINSAKQITLKAAAIQPNLNHKIREASRLGQKQVVKTVMDKHYELTGQILSAHPDVEVIVWPETTFPFLFKNPSSVYEKQVEDQLTDYVNNHHFYLVFGSFGLTGENKAVRNNIYTLHKNNFEDHFAKTILFPFGEYLPFREYMPWAEKFFPNINYTSPSIKQNIIPLKVNEGMVPSAASICYEVLFADKFQKAAQLGGQLIFTVSNESWFYPWGEPQISLMLTSVRSMETHIPVIRSANTGHSAFISATGEITQKQEMNQEGWIYQEIKIPQIPPSIYTQYGDWFTKLGWLIFLIWSIVLWRRK